MSLGPTWSVVYFHTRAGDRQITEATVSYEDELRELVDYARMVPLSFTIIWDAAEVVAGRNAGRARAQRALSGLIGDMLDRGVRMGDMSPRESVLPWDLTREESLRVAEEMAKHDDAADFVDICWFGSAAGQ